MKLSNCAFLSTPLALALASQCLAVVINVPADFATVEAAVNAASPGDEVVIAPGTYVVATTINPLGKAITIRSASGNPNDTALSGAGVVRLFRFDSGETAATVVSGLKLRDGFGTGGAAFIGRSSPTFTNVVFELNSANTTAGALQISLFNFDASQSGPCAPLFENCVFLNNAALGTGTTNRGGAASVVGANPTFRGCTFTGNSSRRIGGAIAVIATTVPANGPVLIENCVFDGNVCNGTGGNPAVSVDNRAVTIRGSTFRNHTTTSAAGGTGVGMSGATAQPLVIENTVFTAQGSARPILSIGRATVTITGGSFTSNTLFGGCISLQPATGESASLVLTGTVFSNNQATVGVNNVPLIATTGNGNGTYTITDAAFTNNTCSAVFVANGANTVNFNGGSLSGNVGGGGMIVCNPVGSMTIDGTDFSGSTGMVFATGPGDFVLRDSTVTNTTGATAVLTDFTTATIEDVLVTNAGTGGAVATVTGSESGTLTVRRLTLTGGTLTGSSVRALNLTGLSAVNIEDLTATGQTAAGSSAALIGLTEVTDATLERVAVSGLSFTGSSSSVVSSTGVGTLGVSDSTVSGNTAARVLIVNGPGSATVSGLTAANNSGEVLNFTDVSGEVSSSSFLGNRAGINFASSDPTTLDVSGTVIAGGLSNGGLSTGIAVGGAASANIRGCTLLGNRDGGIELSGTGTHGVTNTLIAGVTGNNRGGLTVSETATATVTNCTITANFTGGGAGGVQVVDDASATIANTIIHGNNAPNTDFSTLGVVTVTYSNVEGGASGMGNIDAAPLFADVDGADNLPNTPDDDYGLLAGSPGIDAGDNGAVPAGVTLDLAGNPRFIDGPAADTGAGTAPIVDIGALENQAPSGPLCTQDYNASGSVDGDDLADYIADFFDSTGIQPGFGGPIAIPGGFAGTATLAFTGFGRPCPAAVDVPQPNPWGAPIDAYRTGGYKVSVGINNNACADPNGDDLADYIGIFFNGCP